MGRFKDLQERLGSGDPNACFGRPVCADCFGDEALKNFVETAASSKRCEFCGAEADEDIAADLFDVVEHMNECLDFYYSTAEEKLPYESAEGGYQGEWWSTFEFVDLEIALDLPNDDDGALREAIIDSVGDRAWCRKHPFSLTRDEHLRFSWEEFCRLIKHERRFFFLREEHGAGASIVGDDDLLRPGPMLDQLAKLLDKYGLVVDLPAQSRMFRAREQEAGERHRTAWSLGPPPLERAKANRMSPAGIVMLYVSDDAETALRETADAPGIFAIGDFETKKLVPIIDLTRLPEVPSIFTDPYQEDAYVREELLFLWDFARDIARPIERDDRIHIEYVPTQVVTEYVRTSVRGADGSPVIGIRYSSSRNEGQNSLVLFADRLHIEPSPGDESERRAFPSEPWIRLVGASERTVTITDIDEWGFEPIDAP